MSALDTDWKSPKRVTLNIAVVYTASYFAKDDRGCIAKARDLLDRHNIALNVWPENGGQKGGGNMLSDLTQPIPHSKAAYQALRDRVSALARGSGMAVYMPVVFTQFDHPGYGITPEWFKRLTPGCLIAPAGNDDGVDMLHEMGHGAMSGSDHDHLHGESHRSNIMNEANGRSTIYRSQVEKFAKALFSVA